VSWIHLDGVKTAGVNGGGDGGGGGDGFHFCLKCVIRVDDGVIDYCGERSAIYRKDSKILPPFILRVHYIKKYIFHFYLLFLLYQD